MNQNNRKGKLKLIPVKDRAAKFNEDFYKYSKLLFCKFCQHSIDFSRIHTLKLHLELMKHKITRIKY